MTNKERYQRTFGALHASPKTLEVLTMNEHKRKFRMPKLLVIAACLAALLATTAFAANEITDGKLGATVLYFFNGAAREADLVDNGDGSYTFEIDGVNGRINDESCEVYSEDNDGEDKEIHVLIPAENMDGSDDEFVPGDTVNGN